MQTFKAFRIHQDEVRIVARFDTIGLDDLAAGDVVIRVAYSDINFKDALAATGTRRSCAVTRWSAASISPAKSCRRRDARYAPGQAVLVTGNGLSETHDGGYAEYARVAGDWVIPVPAGLDDV